MWGREKRGAAPVALTLPFAFHPPIPSLTMAFTTLARAPAGVAALTGLSLACQARHQGRALQVQVAEAQEAVLELDEGVHLRESGSERSQPRGVESARPSLRTPSTFARGPLLSSRAPAQAL